MNQMIRGKKTSCLAKARHDFISHSNHIILLAKRYQCIQAFGVVHFHGSGPLYERFKDKASYISLLNETLQMLQNSFIIMTVGCGNAFHLYKKIFKGSVVNGKA